MNKKWTIADIEYLKEYAGQYSDEELAKALSSQGRVYTKIAVLRKRQKLGLKKKRGRSIIGLDDDTNGTEQVCDVN